jgi:protein O-mannosyl-transferase
MTQVLKKYRNQLILAILVLLVIAVFWQMSNHEFLVYDDNLYVTDNRYVQSGFSKESIVWAFTTNHPHFWMPLTWLTLMLDFELFGLNAGGYHITNLLFHIFNTLLLFFVLQKMTGAFWRSLFVAALFALHPLHVESVAWVTERKDVLSTFFWMLVMYSYVMYVERPVWSRYCFILLFFILGLLSKPMLVTLPFVLLLLDYWPLQRLQMGKLKNETDLKNKKSGRTSHAGSFPLSLIWEKLPLFAIAALLIIINFIAQRSSLAVVPFENLSLNARLANALVSYSKYIGKMIWPLNLSVFYPHTGDALPMWQAIFSGILLLCFSLVAIRLLKRLPFLAVGWFWYLGTLVPVIGITQVGAQAMADRFTYVPLIGLFIMVAWGVQHIFKNWRHQREVLSFSAAAAIIFFTACSWIQVQHWKNSITLFQHSVNVTENNFLGHYNLAIGLKNRERTEEAISHFKEALKIDSNYADAHKNLGRLMAQKGDFNEAISYFQNALKINPNDAKAHKDLGVILGQRGNLEESVYHLEEAIRIRPDYADAHVNLGVALNRLGRSEEAVEHYYKALKIDPDDANTHFNLGVALARIGSLDKAVFHFKEVLAINPDDIDARDNLGTLLKIMEGGSR